MREPDYEKALDSILPRPVGRPKKPRKQMGRPPVPENKRRKAISISLPPDIIEAIERERRRCGDARMQRGYSTSHVIEDLVRQVLMNDHRASAASRESALAEELRYFYALGQDARSVWWRNMSGLPGEIDGVLERLTKKFIAYQKARNIEEPLYPPGFYDDAPAVEPEDDSGDFVL